MTLSTSGYNATISDTYNGGDDSGTPGSVFFEGDEDFDGVGGAGDICPGSSIPEDAQSDLNPNHYAVVDDSGTFGQGRSNGVGNQAVYTLDDTMGCTCEQIVDALGLGPGQIKHGCSPGTMSTWVGP